MRELHEELGVSFTQDQVIPLCDYLNEELQTYRHVFYIKSELSQSAFTLGEGRGFEWISLDKLSEYDLTDKTREDLAVFVRSLK